MDKDVFKKMQIDYKLLEIKQKTKKILILLLLLSFGIFIVLFSVYRTIHEKRTLPTLTGEKSELAVRGNIISEDGFNLVSSKKIYKASVDTRYLNPDKKELFMILFSIYSGIDYKTLSEKFKEVEKNPGLLVLSYNIDSRAAKNLRELDIKLNQLNVFVPRKGGSLSLIRRLEVSESGEKRTFSYDDTLTPVLGYIKKIESQTGKTKVDGVKGLERSYDQKLNDAKDGILKGYRDVISYIYFDKNSIMEHRMDGYSLNLNIPLKLQKNNETTLDNHKIRTKADEILLTIMESRTGKIISMASSNRFNPENIKQSDIPYLNVNAIEYQFEPGSVVKPLSISLALDKGVVRKNEYFSAYNQTHAKGAYPFGKFTIKDDHAFPKGNLSIDDIVISSSNIGTLQIAQRLTGPEFYEGMKKFGFTRKTGIDLPYEKRGVMPKLWQFSVGDKQKRPNIYKATVSFGHGMTSTFIQLIKAYSVFNNDGAMVTPQIVSYLTRNNVKYQSPFFHEPEQVISKETAAEMKRMLIKTVQEGTGRSARIEGLEIGGKTGTAQIAGGTGYLKKYISSFVGFVNDDKGNSYTIGVTVINPNPIRPHYYAAQSAVPVFKEIIQNLIKLNYLSPKEDINLEN